MPRNELEVEVKYADWLTSNLSDLPSTRATDIVKDRSLKYGSPVPIGITTVRFWNEWLRVDGTEEVIRPIEVEKDYSPMLALHKFARQCHRENDDNIDDVAGYMNVHRLIERLI